MKHDRFDSRNFRAKQSRLCKVCKKQALKGSHYCSDQCKEKDKQEPPFWVIN